MVLVQAVGSVDSRWWTTVIRYNRLPFYTVPIAGAIADPPENNADRPWLEDSDAEVDGILDRTPTSSPGPIHPSPNKAAPTGHDGLMRTRAGGGAGFDVSSLRLWSYYITHTCSEPSD